MDQTYINIFTLYFRSCVKLGYYKDEYVKHFVRDHIRRPPLINRGYYSRVSGFRKIIKQFLSATTSGFKQIVSLGAGFDTTFWILKVSIQCNCTSSNDP